MHVVQVSISAAFLIRPPWLMCPKITGKARLERWRTFIAEHTTTAIESGGAGHVLAIFTRQKLAAGHLSRSEIAELNRLKREASRASSTNSADAHPAVAPGVGAEHGAADDSGVEQPVAGKHAVSHLVQTLAVEVLAWQRRNGVQSIPSMYSDDCEERNLALRFAKVLLRRDKALGIEPSRSQLSPSEVALVNSVSGVPLHGCVARRAVG